MKGKLLLTVFLVLAGRGVAQPETPVDVFPLAIGNKWAYAFNAGSAGTFTHGSRTDTGYVEYEVIGAAPFPDSTRWQFIQRRIFTRTVYPAPPGPTVIEDSSIFDVVELNGGRHELFTPAYDPYSCLPFQKSYADSSRFFRYVDVDTSGRAAVRVSFVDPSNPYWTYNYSCNFIVSRDSGIVRATGGQFNFVANLWLRYYLVSFSHSPYAGPYLNHPTSVSILSLVGIPKDTTIGIRNIGIDTLRIQGIASSVNALVASLPSLEIPPYRSALLSLRFTSSTEGATSAEVVATSNAVSSPDTIVVSISNMMAASMSLSRRAIDFGTVLLSQRQKDTTVAIRNNGNISLTLDSLRTTNPLFMVSADRYMLGPGETMSSTIRFLPYPPPELIGQQSDIIFFTNSFSSPDTIHVSATAIGGVLGFDTRAIDFGNVAVGSTAGAVVRISALGGAAFLRVQRSSPVDPSFTVLRDFPDTLENWEYHIDSVRFSPLKTGTVSGFVVYSSRSSYIYDTVTATDTIRLSGYGLPNPIPAQFYLNQNFPNPFNSSTTISFGIPSDAFVSLNVFDLLGREVATLVNEDMKAGTGERVFNGSNLASGLYLYRMRAGQFVQTRKILLLR